MSEYFYGDRLFTSLERTEPDSGMLLVAAPGMYSPEFARTVVLVIEHGEQGTLGVILNRRSDAAVVNVLPEWESLASEPAVMYYGGPVSPNAAVGLGVSRNDVDIAEHPTLTRLANKLVHVNMHEPASSFSDLLEGFRLFAGFSSWDAGQLDEEIERGDWYVAPALPSDVITPASVDLWADVLRRQPMPLPLFATFPSDIEDN